MDKGRTRVTRVSYRDLFRLLDYKGTIRVRLFGSIKIAAL
jgi:hypothetical protein